MSGRSRRRSRRPTSRSSKSSRSPIEVSALQRSQRNHNITLRGRRTNNVRAQGMPIESNFIPIHRLGSRVPLNESELWQREGDIERRFQLQMQMHRERSRAH